jgi:adenosylcobinamide amidohydrolase
MITGVAITVDPEAVVVRADEPLTVLSSAVVGGGFGKFRVIMNLHVPRSFRCADSEIVLAEFAQRRGLAPPWVGLLTAAWTEKAELGSDTCGALTAVAVATVGLSNVMGAGRGRPTAWAPSTINTIISGTFRLVNRYAFLQALDLTARIQNLLDESYAEVRGFPALGLQALVGLRASF